MRYWDAPDPIDVRAVAERLREVVRLLAASYPPIRFTPRL